MTSESPRNRLTGMTKIEIAVTIVLLLACMGLIGAWPGTAFFLLVFGWLVYPFRVAGELTVEWTSVLTACTALLLFTGGVYWFGKWLATVKSTETSPRTWSFRNTLRFVVLILFTFLAGTSMIGIVHQVAWLSTTTERFLNPSGARIAADRSGSKNNLKHLGLAFHNYHEVHLAFPTSRFAEDGRAWQSWQTYLLPYIDSNTLYQQINLDHPWNDQVNRQPFETFVPTYQNPGFRSFGIVEAGHPARSHYAGNVQLLRPNQWMAIADITDGAANTILCGEVSERFKAWGDPTNLRDPALGINQTPTGFGGPFKGGANVLFADGAAHFLSEDIDPAILKALATPSGGEEISNDMY